MSSRNLLLSKKERKDASAIYSALQTCKEHFRKKNVADLKATCMEMINCKRYLETEYVEVADANTLLALDSLNEVKSAVCCVAVYAGKVRLIDNVILYN